MIGWITTLGRRMRLGGLEDDTVRIPKIEHPSPFVILRAAMELHTVCGQLFVEFMDVIRPKTQMGAACISRFVVH